MITKIGLNCIASFENLETLETNKKINLVYGLNGTGKSTFSNYLYDRACTEFSNCIIEGLTDEIVHVYNKRFIRDYFYESDNLKGIFTLSKENKEAEEKIRIAENEIKILDQEKINTTKEKDRIISELSKKKQDAENKIWEIKTTFSGGDRVLEFCLDRLKGKKDKLYGHISSLSKPSQKPEKTIEGLKKEVEPLKGENAQKYDPIPLINFKGSEVESNNLLQKEIIGNENSTVAGLIKTLDNQDWVKKGLDYLPSNIDDSGALCPFCQNKTITKAVVSNIRDYFNETYETEIGKLKDLLSCYETATSSIQSRETYEVNPFVVESKTEFENLYNLILKLINENKRKINEKLTAPSQKVFLGSSSESIEALNQFIKTVNIKTDEHNQKIDNKEEALSQINKTFWEIMRWDYDQTLGNFQKELETAQKILQEIEEKIFEQENNLSAQRAIIASQQKNTINIDEAISNINNGLIELGIDNFRLTKHSDNLYKIVRDKQSNDTFQTLSEGEKMIISFLYFREQCKGKMDASETKNKKIIVIDDPISSLSHVYIFNIGQMIKNDFFKSPLYDQVFVLTHSLYFFYELADTKHTRRKENQKLFRMIKNLGGSKILDMKYDEIQNDYHSYWHIIKDDKQPPALIANCMRNIVEYFFNFIEKKELYEVFTKTELKENKYQAFCRYIDRESHSVGQNIFDYKEFNYNDFKEALCLLFKESGYQEHYEKMIT